MKLDFCPTCGAELKALNNTHYRCVNDHDYFNNPRAAVSIMFLNDHGEILFVRRAREPKKGCYDFPGGFVDFGEDAATAAHREIQEELGVTAISLKLVTTVANHYDPLTTTVDCVFICREWEGEFQPADDVASVSWHPVDFVKSPEFAWDTSRYVDLPDLLKGHL